MAFKAGAITADALLNTSQWERGIKTIDSTSSGITKKLGTLAKIGFAATAAAMGVATYKTIAFDKEMRNVSTLIDDQPAQFEAMRQSIIDMDAELGTAKDLASGLYQALSAGAKPGKEALDVVTQSAKFAVAALTDTNTAVDIITTAMNAYGKENINASKASDLFFTTIKQGKITGQELSATIGQSIPLFASVGIELEELTAGIATMTKQGIKSAEATTQMNAVVNAFLRPSQSLTVALKNIGYESGAAFLEAEKFSGALEFLQKETKGEKSELGKLMPSIRAMKGAMALTGKGTDIFVESLEAARKGIDSSTRAFKKQLDPIDTSIKTFDKLAVIVGQAGKAFLDELAVALTETAKKMIEFFKNAETMETLKDMAKSLANAIIDLASFVGGLVKTVIDLPAPLKSAVLAGTGLAILIPKLIAGFVALKTAVMAFNASAMLGPTGLIVLAGAAVAALITLGIQRKKNAMAVVKQREESVRLNTAYSDVNEQAKNMIDNIGDLSTEFKNFNIMVSGGSPAVNMLEELEKQLSAVENEIKKTELQMGKGVKTSDEYMQKQVQMVGTSGLITQAGLAFNQALKEGVDVTTAREKEEEGLNQKLQNSQKAREKLLILINEINNAIIAEADKTKDLGDAVDDTTDGINESLEENKTGWALWSDFVAENLKTLSDKFHFWADQTMQLMNTLYSGISDISSLHYQNEKDKLTIDTNEKLNTLKTAYDTDMAALTTQFENKTISEDEYNKKSEALSNKHESDKTKIEKDALKDRNDLAKKQFKNQKALNIAGIWMDSATAALGFWKWGASLGPPGWITAGIQTAAAVSLAAVKTALVTKQRFVPEYAEGTNYHPGGSAIVGEEGPEIIDFPTGSRVIPNDVSESMMSGYGKEISININNPIVRQDNDINKIAQAVSGVLGRQLQIA